MIEGFRGLLMSILYDSWPTVLMGVIIAILLRTSYLVTNKKKLIIHDELLNICFIIYILCLFYIVTFQDVSWSSHNFKPFREIFRYEFGSALFFKNIFGNLLLFMPFGFIIGKYVKTNSITLALILGMITSCSIEAIQYKIGRVFDIDDIILNIIGCIIGFIIYELFKKFYDKLPAILRKDIILDILSILLFGGLVWFLIP